MNNLAIDTFLSHGKWSVWYKLLRTTETYRMKMRSQWRSRVKSGLTMKRHATSKTVWNSLLILGSRPANERRRLSLPGLMPRISHEIVAPFCRRQLAFMFRERVYMHMGSDLTIMYSYRSNRQQTLVQEMAWHRTGDKPLPGLMLANLQELIWYLKPSMR